MTTGGTGEFPHLSREEKRLVTQIVIYNNPTYTGNNLSPELIAELAELPGIVGLKQSNADLGQLVEVLRLVGDRTTVLTGIDSQFYPGLCAGARGIFSTAACVVPRQMVQLYAAQRAGDYAAALRLHQELQALNRFLEYDPGYVAPCKEALAMIGLPAGRARPPLPELTPAEREGVRAALVGLGFAVQ